MNVYGRKVELVRVRIPWGNERMGRSVVEISPLSGENPLI